MPWSQNVVGNNTVPQRLHHETNQRIRVAEASPNEALDRPSIFHFFFPRKMENKKNHWIEESESLLIVHQLFPSSCQVPFSLVRETRAASFVQLRGPNGRARPNPALSPIIRVRPRLGFRASGAPAWRASSHTQRYFFKIVSIYVSRRYILASKISLGLTIQVFSTTPRLGRKLNDFLRPMQQFGLFLSRLLELRREFFKNDHQV